MKIEMIGYNDGKAIFIYSSLRWIVFFIISLIIFFVASIFAFVYKIYELLLIFSVPLIILIIMEIINFCLINYNTKVFLQGLKIKHKFKLENSILYKDGKEIKNIDYIKIYKFKNRLFLELKKSYYRIENNDYLMGSREEFLSQLFFYKRHFVKFRLPKKTQEEIIDIIFNSIDFNGIEKFFYSKDKTKIIYIYKNSSGSYSVNREQMVIFSDEEYKYLQEYGYYDLYGDYFASYYGTIQEAYNDIKNEVKDFIEYK